MMKAAGSGLARDPSAERDPSREAGIGAGALQVLPNYSGSGSPVHARLTVGPALPLRHEPHDCSDDPSNDAWLVGQ